MLKAIFFDAAGTLFHLTRTVGDHYAVLIRGAKAADFKKGEMSREEITDLMAGGEAMAGLDAEIESHIGDRHEASIPTASDNITKNEVRHEDRA